MAFKSVSEGIKYFVDNYGNDVANALKGTGIYWAVAVAQKCQESGFGTSNLAKTKNNFGGILIKGVAKKFDSPQHCFAFYAGTLLSPTKKYRSKGLLSAKTPHEQLRAIADGGYCTEPPADEYYKQVSKILDKVVAMYKIGKIV